MHRFYSGFQKFKRFKAVFQMSRGGKRLGAGRPKKYAQREMFGGVPKPAATTPTVVYESAQAYLDAVVAGIEPADPIRVAAAKALLPYETPRSRAPLSAVGKPKQIQALQRHQDEASEKSDWRVKAEEIAARLANSTTEQE